LSLGVLDQLRQHSETLSPKKKEKKEEEEEEEDTENLNFSKISLLKE
jgi:hypothetical protein